MESEIKVVEEKREKKYESTWKYYKKGESPSNMEMTNTKRASGPWVKEKKE